MVLEYSKFAQLRFQTDRLRVGEREGVCPTLPIQSIGLPVDVCKRHYIVLQWGVLDTIMKSEILLGCINGLIPHSSLNKTHQLTLW